MKCSPHVAVFYITLASSKNIANEICLEKANSDYPNDKYLDYDYDVESWECCNVHNLKDCIIQKNKDIHCIYPDSFQYAIDNEWIWQDSDGIYYIVPGQFKNMSKIRSLFYSSNAISWLKNIRDHPQEQYRHRIKALKEKKQQKSSITESV